MKRVIFVLMVLLFTSGSEAYGDIFNFSGNFNVTDKNPITGLDLDPYAVTISGQLNGTNNNIGDGSFTVTAASGFANSTAVTLILPNESQFFTGIPSDANQIYPEGNAPTNYGWTHQSGIFLDDYPGILIGIIGVWEMEIFHDVSWDDPSLYNLLSRRPDSAGNILYGLSDFPGYFNLSPVAVPIPADVCLLGSGLFGFAAFRRRLKK